MLDKISDGCQSGSLRSQRIRGLGLPQHGGDRRVVLVTCRVVDQRHGAWGKREGLHDVLELLCVDSF